MLTTYLAALAISFCLAVKAYRHYMPRTKLAVSPDVTSAVRAVLEPPRSSLVALLSSRAGSNQRLRRSFQLTNTFVSEDPQLHRAFVTKAHGLVQDQSSTRARTAFAELCSVVVDDYLSNATRQGQVARFDDLVQVVTFKVILCSLFDADLGTLNDDDVLFAARTINELWQLSKQPTSPPSHLLPTLNAHLRSWLPGYTNPLDFIIPTYETMWRVVAVSVALVHLHGSPALLDAFADFLDNPGRHEFQHWPLNGKSSLEAVIQETMRLYPPTRRISRTANLPQEATTPTSSMFSFLRPLFSPHHPSDEMKIQTNITVVADIGCLQRDAAIWGPTSTDFDPSRFHPSTLTQTQKQCLLGFGYGRLKCVAKDWAPHTAALITAAVLTKCRGQTEGYRITEGVSVGGREGWEGWEVRRTAMA